MFKSFATLVYDPRNDAATRKGFQFWWLKADVHKSIAFYYRAWLQRELGMALNTPLWSPHITVIRGEEPKKQWLWKKHVGRQIEFSYSPDIRFSEQYAWLQVESKELEEIRTELGLAPQPRVRFHLTLGNRKNLETVQKAANVPFKTFPWEDIKIVEKLWRKN